MKYTEVQILTTTDASDAIWYMLDDEGAEGVTIEDPHDLETWNNGDPSRWDYIEEELIKKMGTDVKIKGYFPAEKFTAERLAAIQRRLAEMTGFGLDIGKGQVLLGEIAEEDWANSWKKFYRPTKVGERIVIKPSWESYEAADDELVVELDPGMAFGTGTHETTSMCIRLIETYLGDRKTVFDVGCGSGILGICAAKLGAQRVLCADFDEMACKVARENAAENGVETIVEVRCGDLLAIVDKDERAELVVANIIADVVIRLTAQVGEVLAENGVFISSGIIRDRKQDVLAQLTTMNYEVLEVLELGEWCAIAARRKA